MFRNAQTVLLMFSHIFFRPTIICCPNAYTTVYCMFHICLLDRFDSVAKFSLRAPYYVGDSVAIIAMDHVSKYLNILANTHNAFNRLRFGRFEFRK